MFHVLWHFYLNRQKQWTGLLDNAIVCFHTPSRQTVTWMYMFFCRGLEWVRSSSVLYFKSSQIYLFDRILVTSCFSAKTDTCFKITEFMFHNHIQTMIKYGHFRSLKIKTYLNIALEGRLSIFSYTVLFKLQKCLIKERNTGGFAI